MKRWAAMSDDTLGWLLFGMYWIIVGGGAIAGLLLALLYQTQTITRPAPPARLVSAYGFLQGAWPFGLVEAAWAGVAVHRWRKRLG